MKRKKSQAQAMSRENIEHKIFEGNCPEMMPRVERRGRWWPDDRCHDKLLKLL